MDFFKDKWFWIILLGAIAVALIIYIFQKKSSDKTGNQNKAPVVAGDGCPSYTGLDKLGKPCPPVGANCPNISGLDVYGNVCPPDCFNGCKSSKPGYDCNGNFSANC